MHGKNYEAAYHQVLAMRREAFKDFELTLLQDGLIRGWQLKRPNTSMYSVTLVFLPSAIVILGDGAPGGRRGVIASGYGIQWFLSQNPREGQYMAEKFLAREWVSEIAEDWISEILIRRSEAREGRPATPAELSIDHRLEDIAECSTTTSAEFHDAIWGLGVLESDEGFDYDYQPHDVATLVALQESFARLFNQAWEIVNTPEGFTISRRTTPPGHTPRV